MSQHKALSAEQLGLVQSAANRVAKHLVRTHAGFRAADPEDVSQDLMQTAIPALEHFDADRGSLGAYTDQVLRNRSLSLIRRQQSAKRDWRRNGPSLDQSQHHDSDVGQLSDDFDERANRRHTGCVWRTDTEQSEMRSDVDTVLKAVPPQHRRYAGLLMEGHSHEQARQRLGESRRAGDQIRRDLLKVFDKNELRKYL